MSPDAAKWVVGDPESSSTSTLFESWDLLPLLRAYWRWLISGIAVDLGVDFQLKWVEYQSETGGISVEDQWKPRAGAFFRLPRLTRGNFLPVLTRTRSTNVQLQQRRKLLKPASPVKFKQYNTFQFRGVLTKLTLFDESFLISIMVFVVHLLLLFYQSLYMNFITLGYSDILCWKIFLSSCWSSHFDWRFVWFISQPWGGVIRPGRPEQCDSKVLPSLLLHTCENVARHDVPSWGDASRRRII